MARTRRRRRGDDEDVTIEEGVSRVRSTRAELRTYYDGTTAQTVRVDGHRVSVAVERHSGLAEGLTLTVQSNDWARAFERITFTAYGAPARDAVLAFLAGLAAENQGGPVRPRMYVASRWGDWRRLRDAPTRALDTVILVDGQKERVVADLARFLDAERLYARVGVPWHRGYLFHGPPGCGKTSLATALADRFGLDVYLLPLSDLDADANLVGLLGQVDERSVLVIEDIDVVHAAKARDDAERKGVTLSGLLNALDGLATPYGLVTVMTTNQLDALDPALVRPGRADLVEEFSYLDDDQASRLAELVVGVWTVDFRLDPARRITHADFIETAKPYLDEPDRIVKLLIDRYDVAAEQR